MTVEEAIEKRKSIRRFKPESLTPDELTKVLWAATKTPSAGGIRPLQIHVISEVEAKNELCRLALNQQAVKDACVNIIIAADYPKIQKRYARRGVRYAILEAGHMAQNIALQAVALGLGTVMIGAFRDKEVKKFLDLKADPLYIIPIGRPKDAL